MYRLSSFVLFLIFCIGCQNEQPLCPEGFSYFPTMGVCLKLPSGDSETESHTSSNTDDTSTVDGIIGQNCTNDSDCLEYNEHFFCVLNPMTPNEEGYCSYKDCSSTQCPSDYRCCDCRSSQLVPEEYRYEACLNGEHANLVQTVGDCVCP